MIVPQIEQSISKLPSYQRIDSSSDSVIVHSAKTQEKSP
jgi:hypothetical protein